MNILRKIQKFLKTKKAKEIRNFTEKLEVKYGFSRYLYATPEGLPVIGNFENYEELSAKIPELMKFLSILADVGHYVIKAGDKLYVLIKISPEIIFLGEGSTEPHSEEIQELISDSLREFGL